jgi:hypothetical protein
MTKGINHWVFGSAVILSFLGIIIDVSTGAAYRLSPDPVHAWLTEASEASRGTVK